MTTMILAAALVALGAPQRHCDDAVEVFACNFDESWDRNYDGWPDQWTRRRGPGYPLYIRMTIDGEPADGARSLRAEMDGGAVAAYSPPIAVSDLFSYVAEVEARGAGLSHDWAYLSLTALDGQRQQLATYCSEKTQSRAWQPLRVGPVGDLPEETRFVVLGLHVEPNGPADLSGQAEFRQVWMGRLPRVRLATAAPFHWYYQPDEVAVQCRITGVVDDRPALQWELLDTFGRPLQRQDVQPHYEPAVAAPGAESVVAASLVADERWQPQVPGPGFYRVRAVVKGRGKLSHERDLSLVVFGPGRPDLNNEFGWTLPLGDHPMPLPELTQLISQAGIRWVKYPLWGDSADDPAALDRLASFIERLTAQDIEVVGLLDRPPKGLLDRFGGAPSPNAAALFSLDPALWYPTLEPMLSRLATQVRWWQLGDDGDTSLSACVDVQEKVAQVKAQLDRIGQDAYVGFGWDWMRQLPADGREPWRLLTLTSDPPLTGQELAHYLDASQTASCRRWVAVQPLPRDDYDTAARVRDLVERMIAAKTHGAEAIFCPNPFDAQHGLMNADGTPGELFYPWRTAATLLGGATHLGSLQLPGGSENHVFVRGGSAVMAVCAHGPREERLSLGANARRVDLFGREEPLTAAGIEQVLPLDDLPVFFVGLSAPLARWQMSVDLARQRIPSIFGRPHDNAVSFRNPFNRGVSGRMTFVAPDDWSIEPRTASFRLAEDEELSQPLTLTLPHTASSGKHQVRIDFEVQADETYRFSVYRTLEVGMGDVYIETSARLNKAGQLEVTQRFVNDTDRRVSFRFDLYAPGRRRMRSQVLYLPRGQDVKVYRLEDGGELLGRELWLQATEIDGPRILNYRFDAGR